MTSYTPAFDLSRQLFRLIVFSLFTAALFFPITACEGNRNPSGSASTSDDQATAQSADATPSTALIPVTTSSEEARRLYEAGMSATHVGRNREANENLRRAVEIDPGFTRAHHALSIVSYSPQAFETAVSKAVATKGDKSPGEQRLADIAQTYLDDDTEGRIALATELAEAYPADPFAWIILGAAYQSIDDHENARASFQTAIERDPEFVAAHLSLGNSYMFEEPRDVETAIAKMEDAANLQPNEAMIQVWLGDAHRADNDLERARQGYAEASRLDPTLAVAHVKVGHVSSFLGDYAAARQSYDTALQQAVGVEKAQLANYRAFVSLHEGNPQAAIDELSSVLEMLESVDVPSEQKQGIGLFIYHNQFIAAVHSGQMQAAKAAKDARNALLQVAIDNSDNETVKADWTAEMHYYDGYFAAMQNRFDDARAAAESQRALLADRTDPLRMQDHHFLQGLIAHREGNAEQAIEHFRQADLGDVRSRFLLAEALEAAGQVDEAKRMFADVATWNFNSVGYALVRNQAIEKGRVL